jgi:hypothetical protein
LYARQAILRYPQCMKPIAVTLGVLIALACGTILRADSNADDARAVTAPASNLSAISSRIEPISRDTLLRRNLAQATFCLPQNVLGIFFYGVLRLAGLVMEEGFLNEVKVIVVKLPIGVSLGRFIFIGDAFLSENTVRHEVGHTLQGYRHGPFYLLLEGAASFTQAAISLISPSFAAGYFTRWPENEADELGGVR